MNDVKNVVLVGVGGQGSLLASRILGQVLINKGYDVKMSEVHGMAQRGGSVVTYVRYGKQVASPLIDAGTADLLISFERLEALRWLAMMKKGAVVIVNDQRIDPMPVITGDMDYPENIIGALEEAGLDVIPVDALKAAVEAGSAKAVNVVMMGVASKVLGFEKQAWLDAIEQTVPERFAQLNKKAFELGLALAPDKQNMV